MSAATPRGKSGGERDCQRGCVEDDVKRTAAPERAFGPHSAAVLLDDALADRQAQAGATFDPRIGGIHLLKAIKDRFEFVERNAAALVSDAEADLAIGYTR
jgi:hypothetical protein